MSRADLLREVAGLVPNRGESHVLVAVDGADGAGKSTFAAELAVVLRSTGRSVIAASVDGFHFPQAHRYRRGRHSAEGFWLDSFDYDQLRSLLVQPLRPGGSGWYVTAVHDVTSELPLDVTPALAAVGSVLVLDGLFLHRDELQGLWDFSIYLDVPLAVSVRRLAARDGSVDDATDPSLERYVGAQRVYQAGSPWARASVVVDNTDLAEPFVVQGVAAHRG